MPVSRREVRRRFHRLLGLFLAAPCLLAAPPGVAGADAVQVSYYPLPNPSLTGLGFPADGGSLWAGGCRVFDLGSLAFEEACRYPRDTRWGALSGDGRTLLATTARPGTSRGRSYRLDAVTGAVLARRRGLWFAPPTAVSPDGARWASAATGPGDAETVSVHEGDWEVVHAGLSAGNSRVYSLEFSSDGHLLHANSGADLGGGTWSTVTWTQTSGAAAPPGFFAQDATGRLGLRGAGATVEVVDLVSSTTCAVLALDITPYEPEGLFSLDGRWVVVKGMLPPSSGGGFGFALVKRGSLPAPCAT